jgi:hypothetical protein
MGNVLKRKRKAVHQQKVNDVTPNPDLHQDPDKPMESKTAVETQDRNTGTRESTPPVKNSPANQLHSFGTLCRSNAESISDSTLQEIIGRGSQA